MDSNNTKLQEIFKLLEAENTPPEAVASVIQTIGEAVSAKVFMTINEALTDEQAKQIDECENDADADLLMRQFFALKSPRSIESLANEFTDVLAAAFLDQYQKDKAAALANPVQPT